MYVTLVFIIHSCLVTIMLLLVLYFLCAVCACAALWGAHVRLAGTLDMHVICLLFSVWWTCGCDLILTREIHVVTRIYMYM